MFTAIATSSFQCLYGDKTMSASDRSNPQSNPPTPDSNPGQGVWLFSFLSIITSLLLIVYGIFFVVGQPLTLSQVGFGGTSVAYGLIALVAQSCALRKRGRRCVLTIQITAVCYLFIYLLAVLIGINTGFGLSGILLLAILLWCQWFAVTQAVRKS
jgi:hypothetical protein